MFDKIWQFLKQLFQRIFRKNRPISTPHQPPTLTDAEFEAKLMELLEGVNGGWGSGDVTEFLIAKRLRDTELADWLRRFGERLLAIDRETTEEGDTASTDSVSSLQELGRRLELLRGICGGELGEAAGNVGREILVKFPISPVGDGEGEGEVDGEAEVWYKRGKDQKNLGKYEEAIVSYEKALKIKPDYEAAWYNRGIALNNSGKFEEAIASYDKALEFKPDYHEVWTSWGIALNNLGKFEEAIASYDKALEIKPDDHSIWFIRGYALDKLGKFEEAIASYDKALKFKPDKHEAWFDRGIALRKLGKLEEAIASYDKALEIKPDYQKAWYSRGYALDDLGRFEEAIASYDKALKFKPDKHEAWFDRGIALRKLGKLEEAIASFDKALEIKPDYHEAWNWRGSILCDNLKKYEEAIASYDKALEFKPDDHDAWYSRGIALGNLGRLEDAIASYDKALAIKPDDHEALFKRGITLDDLERFEEAITFYDKALEIKRDYHEAWYNRGVALGKLGRFEEAIASYDKALKIKPDKHNAWYNRGIALHNLEKWKEAITSYDKALKITPDDHYTWYNRGAALHNVKRWKEAIASYDKALEIKPDHDAWHNRAVALHNLERWIEAIASYDKALELKPDDDAALKNRRLALAKSGVVEGVVYYHDKDYQEMILAFKKQLDNCQPNTHPEEWGKLHQAIGNAHYRRGRWNAHTFYWTKAVNNYEQALITLTPSIFTKLYLNVLQDAIKALMGLEKTEKANKLRRDATDLLHRLLTDKNYTQLSKQQLTDKLVRFEQLTVNILLQSGKLTEALETAEQDKNICLSWLLNALPIPDYQEETEATVTHPQIQQLLNPTTCAIYWHLSDAALTTFIIKSDGLLSPEDCLSKSPDELEAWVKKWNQQYADYQDKFKEKANKQNHIWRAGMPSNFARLKDILQIAHIEQQLQSNSITNLILIPHRDLHRFPIHALFSSDFVITYLPSAQFGLNLKHRLNSEIAANTGNIAANTTVGEWNSRLHKQNPPPRVEEGEVNFILSIENPDSIIIDENGQRKKLLPLPAAEIESEIICRMFPNPTRRGENAATIDEVTKLLPQPHNIFHFTGHGSYDFDNPQQSTLYLSDTHRLTVKEIIQLNLSNYKLICLSACETAVTDKQTILAEYVGLISGFMCAGVGCVVSTLWPVQSGASTLLMIDFYRRWREDGDSLPVALANSQKWLQSATRDDLAAWYQREIDKISENSSELSEVEVSLRRFFKSNRQNLAKMESDQPYQHPYYWAAFTLTGL